MRHWLRASTATACARLVEAHERKVVIGQALFDGEGHCTAVQKVIMVSLNEETHRSTPFDPAVREDVIEGEFTRVRDPAGPLGLR